METKTTKTEYDLQAEAFLTKTGAKLEVIFDRYGKYFDDDKEPRDIYEFILVRGNRSYRAKFGQSIAQSQGIKDTNDGQVYPLNKEILGKSSASLVHDPRYNHRFQQVGKTTPTAYDILACLQKYEVGTFEDFCGDFGYDTDSRKAEKTYNVVRDEYLNLCKLFSDEELKEMAEIQ